jgi:hypothetical protein
LNRMMHQTGQVGGQGLPSYTGFFHWAGWGAHAEARMKRVAHAEW